MTPDRSFFSYVLLVALGVTGCTTTPKNVDAETDTDTDSVIRPLADTDLVLDTATTDTGTPTLPTPMVQIDDLSACALNAQGEARCWGMTSVPDTGGDGSPIDAYIGATPQGTFHSISSGYHVFVGLSAAGQATIFPERLRNPTSESAYAFLADTSQRWRLIDHNGTFGNRGCGVTVDGELLCTHAVTPPPVPSGWLSVDVGPDHVCGIHQTRGLECWGNADEYGDLPVDHPDALDVDADQFTCVVTAEGRVACEGVHIQNWVMDTAYLDIRGATKVRTSNMCGCALLTDGKISCWGTEPHDYTDNLGEDAPTDGGYIDLDVSRAAACAMRANGDVVCWGNGIHGRLDVPTP